MTQKKKRKPFSLYERNGFFYVRLWDEAAGKYTSAKTNGENKRDQAVIKAHEMVKAGQVKPREQDPYFIDLLSVYWTDRNDLSPKYKSEVLKKIETVVKPSKHLKNVRMSEIDAGHLNRLKNDIQKNNTPRATNRIMQYLKTFISWAFEMRYLQNDFARQIKKIKESKIRRGFLEPDESMRLAALEWKDLRIKTAVCLGLFAGLRKGEIRALRWRNIDFDKLTISVEENFTGDYDSTGAPIFKAPKAESNRNFPYLMFAELKAVLLILKAESPFTGPDDLCLVNVWSTTTKNQNQPMQYQPMNEISIARDFKKMLEAIGISLDEQKRRKLVFHSLRHSFTSLMSVVAPMSAVMQLTGHDSAAAFSGYQHGIKNTAVEAIAAANIYLEQYRDCPALPEPEKYD